MIILIFKLFLKYEVIVYLQKKRREKSVINGNKRLLYISKRMCFVLLFLIEKKYVIRVSRFKKLKADKIRQIKTKLRSNSGEINISFEIMYMEFS